METFIEIGHAQVRKHGQNAEGDVFLSRKDEHGRVISVLSDGLGSGIKAGVLATLTATMAAKFVAEDIPIRRAAGIIMKTLPVCKVRKISYATFSIADIAREGRARIIEYGNPPFVLIRDGKAVELEKSLIAVRRSRSAGSIQNPAIMKYTELDAMPGDRLIVFSDGVTQAGMGGKTWPRGWGQSAVVDFCLGRIAANPAVSARALAHQVVTEAVKADAGLPKDDISCGVAYFREPRKLLVMTGPPINPARDSEMADIFRGFPGQRVIAGGTTATILARELGLQLKLDLENLDAHIPPASTMEGAALVTEGIITLCKVAECLEGSEPIELKKNNPARRIAELLLDSDVIDFVVGTKINEAHQDPSMPLELEMRRTIVKRITKALRESHLKEAAIRFL